MSYRRAYNRHRKTYNNNKAIMIELDVLFNIIFIVISGIINVVIKNVRKKNI
jgi:hypothetical protein